MRIAFSTLMHGQASLVSDELCSFDRPEELSHGELIAAIGNALNRIAKLEQALERLHAPAQGGEGRTE